MTHESDIEAYLVSRIKALGGKCQKHVCPSEKGDPDRLCSLPVGLWRMWLVEVKRPGEEPDFHQKRRHREWRAAGGRVDVVDSFMAVDAMLDDVLGKRPTPPKSE